MLEPSLLTQSLPTPESPELHHSIRQSNPSKGMHRVPEHDTGAHRAELGEKIADLDGVILGHCLPEPC